MRKVSMWVPMALSLVLLLAANTYAQNKIITVPRPIQGAPFKIADSEDLFGKAYRWFIEGQTAWAADSLRALLRKVPDFIVDERNDYFIVVADYGDLFVPMGMFHEGSDFYDTRLFGLTNSDVYYVFISARENAESFLSVTLTAKQSPFEAGLLDFISLFTPVAGAVVQSTGNVWIDIRKFNVPETFQKNSDISIIVKRSVDSEKFLTSNVFDNTALERWSFGIATAITSTNDVDIIVGSDGRIVVVPKPFGDFAMYGVLNYHFKPVDTKLPTVASSFHILAGLRLDSALEPLAGVGFGFPTGLPVEVHFFGGLSVSFANELKSSFAVGNTVAAGVDPFGTKVRARPRFGIELKFP